MQDIQIKCPSYNKMQWIAQKDTSRKKTKKWDEFGKFTLELNKYCSVIHHEAIMGVKDGKTVVIDKTPNVQAPTQKQFLSGAKQNIETMILGSIIAIIITVS